MKKLTLLTIVLATTIACKKVTVNNYPANLPTNEQVEKIAVMQNINGLTSAEILSTPKWTITEHYADNTGTMRIWVLNNKYVYRYVASEYFWKYAKGDVVPNVLLEAIYNR